MKKTVISLLLAVVLALSAAGVCAEGIIARSSSFEEENVIASFNGAKFSYNLEDYVIKDANTFAGFEIESSTLQRCALNIDENNVLTATPAVPTEGSVVIKVVDINNNIEHFEIKIRYISMARWVLKILGGVVLAGILVLLVIYRFSFVHRFYANISVTPTDEKGSIARSVLVGKRKFHPFGVISLDGVRKEAQKSTAVDNASKMVWKAHTTKINGFIFSKGRQGVCAVFNNPVYKDKKRMPHVINIKPRQSITIYDGKDCKKGYKIEY